MGNDIENETNNGNNLNLNNIITQNNENYKNIDIVWFDENIKNYENQTYAKQLRPFFHSLSCYDCLEEGFFNFFMRDFRIIFTIVSGKLWGKYLKMLKEKKKSIINIPYTIIFTSKWFSEILLQKKKDEKFKLSYDSLMAINHPFYNPGSVVYTIDDIKKKINDFNIKQEYEYVKRIEIEKKEGQFKFYYIDNEDDLISPIFYKDLILNEPILENEKEQLYEYFFAVKNNNITNLIQILKIFKYIPFEILSKYFVRCYTFESNFYKYMNRELMELNLKNEYKIFIKILYWGLQNGSLYSFNGENLYRGSSLNKYEMYNILDYKSRGYLNKVLIISKAFSSFTEKKSKAIEFIKTSNENEYGVLFILEKDNEINIDSNADIQFLSFYPQEEEILFFPGSSFIIKEISQPKNNIFEIKLNYNGKFKKYKYIYNQKKKINNLIINNEITYHFFGNKELEYMNEGKYLLIQNEYIEIDENEKKIVKKIIKAKDVNSNKNVYIKEIIDEKYFSQLKNVYQDIQNETNYISSLIDTFYFQNEYENTTNFYIVVEPCDDNLYNYLKENKNIPINLIHKIITQLNVTFKAFRKDFFMFGERDINLKNIGIKYLNEKKNNFNSYLNEYGIMKYKNDYIFCENEIYFSPNLFILIQFCILNVKLDMKFFKMKSELFMIGKVLYELYFNEAPFGDLIVDENTFKYKLIKMTEYLKKRILREETIKKNFYDIEKEILIELKNKKKEFEEKIFELDSKKYDKNSDLLDLIKKLLTININNSIDIIEKVTKTFQNNEFEEYLKHPFFSLYKY